MKFELIVPKTEKCSEDDIVAMYIADYQERLRGDWSVIPQKYVTYGECHRPGEVGLSSIVGEITAVPQKEADGKWYVDVMLCGNAPAILRRDHLPMYKKFSCPIKVKLNVFTDGVVVMGPITLSFFAPESFGKSLGRSQPVQKCIYVLQAFRRYIRNEENPTRDERNIGWYSTLDAAIENLHANKDVIAETMPDDDGVDYPYYQYALIEKVPEGLYACGLENEDDAVKFFEWKDGDYVEMERPKELEGVVGFTVG